jgi:hypothetical protein
LRTRTDYDRAFEIVKSVIDAWDPYSLLGGGAPADEFESEATKVVTRIRHMQSPADAAREISSVFSGAFEPQWFTLDACAEVGARLYSELEKAGLLATRET